MLAALMFFTRLPWWKLGNPSKKAFQRVVVWFSWVGWFTGLSMALAFYLSSLIFNVWVAVLIAILTRLVVTGCLHEDGLADFFDGFGGGVTRERILEIMKDSHIGTYGVIALIMYFMLLTGTISSNPIFTEGCSNLILHITDPKLLMALLIFAFDPLSKGIAINSVLMLPYARTEETAKSKIVYDALSVKDRIISNLGAVIPITALSILLSPMLLFVICGPLVVSTMLVLLMNKRLKGYTGDCCGATFLMSELAAHIAALITLTIMMW